MLPDRLDRILAAGGCEATGGRRVGADILLIEADRQDQ